ncbi:MAG: response regulator [bacterium]
MDILIVDDSRAMRMIVKKTLRDAGFDDHEFYEAEDGQVGLEKVKEISPDLILSDWNMPNMNGIDFLRALREEGVSTEFGFITTEATTEMRDLATNTGAQFLITKPFTVESFEETLGDYIK